MASKSQQNPIVVSDASEEAASASEEPQTANDSPVSVSTSDNVLSASQAHGQVTVGGVTVIEHEQDNGEASQEAGGA